MSEEPVEVQAESKPLRPDQVPSDNPAFTKLDEELLRIFKAYRAQRIAISLMMAVATICFITVAYSAVALLVVFSGCIMYLYNLGNIVSHFGLVRRYRVELALQGVETTPVFARAVAAKSKAIGSLVLASIPGGLVLLYIGTMLLNHALGR